MTFLKLLIVSPKQVTFGVGVGAWGQERGRHPKAAKNGLSSLEETGKACLTEEMGRRGDQSVSTHRNGMTQARGVWCANIAHRGWAATRTSLVTVLQVPPALLIIPLSMNKFHSHVLCKYNIQRKTRQRRNTWSTSDQKNANPSSPGSLYTQEFMNILNCFLEVH